MNAIQVGSIVSHDKSILAKSKAKAKSAAINHSKVRIAANPKPLKLSGNMVSGDQCDLSGHPNPEY